MSLLLALSQVVPCIVRWFQQIRVHVYQGLVISHSVPNAIGIKYMYEYIYMYVYMYISE